MYIFGACFSYHCNNCNEDFSKVGIKKEHKEAVICPHCESDDTTPQNEFLEIAEAKEKKKKK
jgi:Zn finger protein HypA/HybF involved in hydrogenase expression